MLDEAVPSRLGSISSSLATGVDILLNVKYGELYHVAANR